MKALCIDRFGGSDGLALREIAKPVPGPHDVLVRVVAASVNPRDWLLQQGRYPFKAMLGPFPITLGSDFSGIVEAVGNKVSRFAIGDAVFGMRSRMGAFADGIAVPEGLLARKPEAISHAEAAAIPCAGLTAFQSLMRLGKLRARGKVVVYGAAGGVGTFALQIAAACGADVTAVASARNADLCRSLGASNFVDRESSDFTRMMRNQDVVFDAVGRSTFSRCRPVLEAGGHYITTVPSAPAVVAALTTFIATLGGVLPLRRAHMILVRGRPADLDAIGRLMVEGRVRSIIAQRFEFADAAAAFAKSKSWNTNGKIVLDMA